MSTSDLLRIEPQELQFPLELRKLISCSLRLSNETDNYVAFEVMRTNQEKYWVRPCTGIVLPRSTCDVKVTMDALMEAPLDMQCKDKFLIRSVTASPGAAAKDIAREMFYEVSGRKVQECKMMVFYVAPPRPSSQVREGSSPGASISDSRDLNNLEFTARKVLSSPLISPCDSAMSTGNLLRIKPQELRFPFELRKLISCSLQLSNETHNYAAFEAMTTKPKKYFVRPNTEIVLPRSTCDVKGSWLIDFSVFNQTLSSCPCKCYHAYPAVTMQAQTEAPPDMNRKDKLLFQSVTASPRATAKDITLEMFNAEPGRDVKECKLRVVYVAPPRPPSQVREGFSPRASVPAIRNSNNLEFTAASWTFVESQDDDSLEPFKEMPKSRTYHFAISISIFPWISREMAGELGFRSSRNAFS